jgi:hypothetical protein
LFGNHRSTVLFFHNWRWHAESTVATLPNPSNKKLFKKRLDKENGILKRSLDQNKVFDIFPDV